MIALVTDKAPATATALADAGAPADFSSMVVTDTAVDDGLLGHERSRAPVLLPVAECAGQAGGPHL